MFDLWEDTWPRNAYSSCKNFLENQSLHGLFLSSLIWFLMKELADHLTEIVVDAVQCIRRPGHWILNTFSPLLFFSIKILYQVTRTSLTFTWLKLCIWGIKVLWIPDSLTVLISILLNNFCFSRLAILNIS